MTLENILYDVQDGIATITINRPEKLNALNIQTIREIGMAMHDAEKDVNIKGVILTGTGSKAFVAGADIAEFANFSEKEGKAMSEAGHKVFDDIENLTKPVLAAINGFALGGGCELAMACHLRIAATNARFGQPEVNLGIVPGYGGTQRLARLIGITKATELLLTGDMIKADEAKSLGLINYVVDPEELISKAKELMTKIAEKSPVTVRNLLKLVQAFNHKDMDGFKFEIDAFGQSFNTYDFKEGTKAFLEKRKAVFKGN